MTKIKICGLFRAVDIAAANLAQPDYVGFVFAAKSHRYVTLKQARKLRQQLDDHIPTVGVYMNATLTEIQTAFNAGIIQLAQLHGQVSQQLIEKLQALQIPVIQAVSATDQLAGSPADYLLLDSAQPGSGQAFDWQTVPRPQQPFFLAGGITPTNVTQAIEALQPTVIDVSSGIETNQLKDRQKILSIVRSAHNAN